MKKQFSIHITHTLKTMKSSKFLKVNFECPGINQNTVTWTWGFKILSGLKKTKTKPIKLKTEIRGKTVSLSVCHIYFASPIQHSTKQDSLVVISGDIKRIRKKQKNNQLQVQRTQTSPTSSR